MVLVLTYWFAVTYAKHTDFKQADNEHQLAQFTKQDNMWSKTEYGKAAKNSLINPNLEESYKG